MSLSERTAAFGVLDTSNNRIRSLYMLDEQTSAHLEAGARNGMSGVDHRYVVVPLQVAA